MYQFSFSRHADEYAISNDFSSVWRLIVLYAVIMYANYASFFSNNIYSLMLKFTELLSCWTRMYPG